MKVKMCQEEAVIIKRDSPSPDNISWHLRRTGPRSAGTWNWMKNILFIKNNDSSRAPSYGTQHVCSSWPFQTHVFYTHFTVILFVVSLVSERVRVCACIHVYVRRMLIPAGPKFPHDELIIGVCRTAGRWRLSNATQSKINTALFEHK